MPALHPELRRLLEKTVIAARQVAEEGSKTVLQSLAVHLDEPYASLTESQREQRRQLRAEERRLGGFDTLVSEVAYEAWHTRLFARFLLENNLLMYGGFAVSAEDLRDEEVQKQFGVTSPQALSSAMAGKMLPGLFEPQDPSWNLALPPEHADKLEKLLNELPPPVFEADDSLGWVYQFWQGAQKKLVNEKAAAGGNRIAARDVPAVTQLFTEPYMVDWLLDQSLTPILQATSRDLSQLKVLDPCCGSGHFLVAAFRRIVAARMAKEELSSSEAGDRVLAENLHGLELDPRCVQLAGFNLMFVAWRHGGYRLLPLPQLACSGQSAGGKVREWQEIVPDEPGLQSAIIRLHPFFDDAPVLGSLLDPRGEAIYISWDEMATALEAASANFGTSKDPVSAIIGGGALGLLRATKILSQQYDLVVTNVPYLARGRHNLKLADFCAKHYPAAKVDLATVFVERCLRFCTSGGTAALVTPQNWLFLGSYKTLREKLLRTVTWEVVAKLGEGGFTSSAAAGAFVALSVLQNQAPKEDSVMRGWDVSAAKTPEEKAKHLRESESVEMLQAGQLANPGAIVTLSTLAVGNTIEEVAKCWRGLVSSDDNRFIIKFWELANVTEDWKRVQLPPQETEMYTGRTSLLRWEDAKGSLHSSNATNFPSPHMLERFGVAVQRMRELNCTIFSGEIFGDHVAPIIPHNPDLLLPLWCYCNSDEFKSEVRKVDSTLKVAVGSFLKIPWQFEKWQQIAEEKYPDGLPEPFSNDPTQWLFDGSPQTALGRGSYATLQVAMGRLLGYLWPEQKSDPLDDLADEDGILPLVPVAGEITGHERLRKLLEVALQDYTPSVLESMLGEVGYGGKALEDYLRNGFFADHCKMFHNRPFLWHIWDGRADGFAAILNYHKVDHARLEKLTYTYLGDYLKNQRDAAARDVASAGVKVAAAEELQMKLIAILGGESPYDIYVRWKKLEEQPIGWNPDINDGVRLNIRPFVEAGVLRSKINIHWKSDRGKIIDGSERVNDLHLTLAEKRAART